MYEACLEAYKKAYKSGDYLEDMHLNAQLLYVWRKLDDQWTPPLEKQKQISLEDIEKRFHEFRMMQEF